MNVRNMLRCYVEEAMLGRGAILAYTSRTVNSSVVALVSSIALCFFNMSPDYYNNIHYWALSAIVAKYTKALALRHREVSTRVARGTRALDRASRSLGESRKNQLRETNTLYTSGLSNRLFQHPPPLSSVCLTERPRKSPTSIA